MCFVLYSQKLNKQSRLQTDAFLDGLQQIIDADWVRMFAADELSLLLSGTKVTVDMEDLRKK